MPISRIGKAREATEFTAEKYKLAIRKYMEVMGYAQTTDSSLEGHPADMIFLPQANMPWPEVWVESKASDLSLSNRDFANEVRAYLRQWLSRTPQKRFKFMIFAKHLSNSSRWESVWGNDLSQEEVIRWLTEGQEQTSIATFVDPESVKDVVSFFSETMVTEGNDADLIDAANEKRRVAMTANDIRQRARHQLVLMEQRSRPVPKKSDLISNLLQFAPPSSFVVLETNSLSTSEVLNLMKGRNAPPYRVIEKGKLLTLNTPDSQSDFAILNPTLLQTLTLEEVEKAYPNAIAQLTNSAIWRFLRPLGVGSAYRWYYFLAERQAIREESRLIRTSSGETMQVARPLYLPEKEEKFPAKRTLNFVFHQAFRIKYRTLWGQHYIEFSLSRLYTKDGAEVIDGTKASKIDARFRNPIFDRSETRQRKLAKLAEYIFHSGKMIRPKWASMFSFRQFLRVPTDWTPDSVPIDQTMMDEFEEEAASDDND